MIAGNLTGGITLFGQLKGDVLAPVMDTLIEGNDIGNTLGGTWPVPNGSEPTTTGNDGAGTGYGIGLAGASDTTIGGTASGAGNLISGNDGYGIVMTQFVGDISGFDNTGNQPVPTTGNLIEGNRIGTKGTGTAELDNNLGVFIAGATNNTIGGTVAAARNVISGNVQGEGGTLGDGVAIVGNDAVDGVDDTANVVEGNFIGTEYTGNAELGNQAAGVYVGDASLFDTTATGVASGATIGGSAAGAGNVIDSNFGSGVEIFGTVATDSASDLVQGNSIGVYANGSSGNSDESGNISSGIEFGYSSGLSILGNLIENNHASGVDGSSSNGTTIGGSASGAGNIITANNGFGVGLLGDESSLSTGDLIEDNLIGVLADFSLIGNGSTGIYATNTNGLVIVGNTVEASGLYSNIENALIATSGIEIDTSVGTTIGGTTSARAT